MASAIAGQYFTASTHLRAQGVVGVLLEDHHLVGVLVEPEDVGRLAWHIWWPWHSPRSATTSHDGSSASRLALGASEADDPRRRYLTRQGCSSWITILEVSSR